MGIVEVYERNTRQHVMMHFTVPLCEHYIRSSLSNIRLQDCEASVPEDKELIVSKISDVDVFNRKVRGIVYRNAISYFEVHLILALIPILTMLLLSACFLVLMIVTQKHAFRAFVSICGICTFIAICLLPLSIYGDAYAALLLI